MKAVVHVTVSYSVTINEKDLRAELSKPNITVGDILEAAKNRCHLDYKVFDTTAEIFETYDDEPKVRKGIGSY